MNGLASTYSEIAQRALLDADIRFKQMEKLEFKDEEIYDIEPAFNKAVLVSVVFSAMAIEAFINDYASACFGDKFFLENVDRLSSLSKLQIISKFLFHKELDKGEALYSKVKEVFRVRDRYVHNKSMAFDYSLLDDCSPLPPDEEWTPINPGEENKKDYADAVNGLKALYFLGDYFDFNDPERHAYFGLGLYTESSEDFVEDYVKQVALLIGRKKE